MSLNAYWTSVLSLPLQIRSPMVGFCDGVICRRWHVANFSPKLGEFFCSQVPVLERDSMRGFRSRTLWYSAAEEVYLHNTFLNYFYAHT